MGYEYDLYLIEHRENVKKAFEWLRDDDITDFNVETSVLCKTELNAIRS